MHSSDEVGMTGKSPGASLVTSSGGGKEGQEESLLVVEHSLNTMK